MNQPGKVESHLFTIIISDKVQGLSEFHPSTSEETEHQSDVVLVPTLPDFLSSVIMERVMVNNDFGFNQEVNIHCSFECLFHDKLGLATVELFIKLCSITSELNHVVIHLKSCLHLKDLSHDIKGIISEENAN